MHHFVNNPEATQLWEDAVGSTTERNPAPLKTEESLCKCPAYGTWVKCTAANESSKAATGIGSDSEASKMSKEKPFTNDVESVEARVSRIATPVTCTRSPVQRLDVPLPAVHAI